MAICPPSFDLIDPILFTLGPVDLFGREWRFDLRWYALGYIAGLIGGWRYLVALGRRGRLWAPAGAKKPKSPYTEADADDLLLWAAIGVIAGGRLGYVLFYQPDAIFERPLWIITGITEGGMSFHGGLIGVALALLFTARARKIPLFRVADAVAVVAPIGIFLVRMANFINGELWGRATDLPWAMTFASDRLCLPRHPSQLYEAALEGVVLFIILNVMTWRHHSLARPGLNTGVFLAGYGVFRALVELVREPDAHMPEALQGYVTMGMLLSLPMIIAGAWLIRQALKAPPVKA